ncbi:hypothetical protein SAMN05192539_10587 [Paraburkholderia diazotrophica]|uniref:Uncharacterized protein n=1 Tax=Paraburkholderia diazotrophica TaxID=667676 RepID=A0A1H7EL77_9BURK|nr:hypothetical protein SAMN05192539_10587 [Paraburkholderia diazotrophica]
MRCERSRPVSSIGCSRPSPAGHTAEIERPVSDVDKPSNGGCIGQRGGSSYPGDYRSGDPRDAADYEMRQLFERLSRIATENLSAG